MISGQIKLYEPAALPEYEFDEWEGWVNYKSNNLNPGIAKRIENAVVDAMTMKFFIGTEVKRAWGSSEIGVIKHFNKDIATAYNRYTDQVEVLSVQWPSGVITKYKPSELTIVGERL